MTDRKNAMSSGVANGQRSTAAMKSDGRKGASSGNGVVVADHGVPARRQAARDLIRRIEKAGGLVVDDGELGSVTLTLDDFRTFVQELEARPKEPASGPLVTVSARDLLASPPPAPVEVVPGIIPVGLSLLAAKPKIGKSWLTYQASVAIAMGGELLGQPARLGDVLYLALEDGPHRAWSRISSILKRAHDRTAFPLSAGAIDVAFVAERGEPMVDQVEEWLSRHPKARFVAIDTLQKIRPRSSGKRNQYELDVEDVGRVLGITKRHPDLAVMVVHHDRKERGDDFLEAVSGTHGISGSVDTTLVLRRRRHESNGTLEITGRDVRESLMHLSYDDGMPYWSLDRLGGLSDEQRELYDWIEENGASGATAVANAVGKDRTSVFRTLDRLADAGVLKKQRGVFDLHLRIRNSSNKNNEDIESNGSNESNDGEDVA